MSGATVNLCDEILAFPLVNVSETFDLLAGATLTGDGRIALILDVPSLVRMHLRSRGRVLPPPARAA